MQTPKSPKKKLRIVIQPIAPLTNIRPKNNAAANPNKIALTLEESKGCLGCGLERDFVAARAEVDFLPELDFFVVFPDVCFLADI